MRKRSLCCHPVSVRPSDTLVHCIQTAEDIVKTSFSTRYPITRFLTPCADTQFHGEPLLEGRKIHGVGKILRFSTAIAVYLGNGAMVTMER